ncbi:MAG: hypothetical protein RMM08_07570, partial [Armatimonadota bacterium]|nr:hypothetical protein [Armatimonadota bacterium]
ATLQVSAFVMVATERDPPAARASCAWLMGETPLPHWLGMTNGRLAHFTSARHGSGSGVQ